MPPMHVFWGCHVSCVRVVYSGFCLQQFSVVYDPKHVQTVYYSYQVDRLSRSSLTATLFWGRRGQKQLNERMPRLWWVVSSLCIIWNIAEASRSLTRLLTCFQCSLLLSLSFRLDWVSLSVWDFLLLSTLAHPIQIFQRESVCPSFPFDRSPSNNISAKAFKPFPKSCHSAFFTFAQTLLFAGRWPKRVIIHVSCEFLCGWSWCTGIRSERRAIGEDHPHGVGGRNRRWDDRLRFEMGAREPKRWGGGSGSLRAD